MLQVPIHLVYMFVGSALAVQAWILKEIISMRSDIAVLKGQVNNYSRAKKLALLFLVIIPMLSGLIGCASDGSLVSPKQWIQPSGTNSYTVNPDVKKSLDTITQTSQSLPLPIQTGVSLAAGLVSLVLAGIAKIKSERARQAEQTLDTVIVGIEDSPSNREVKQKVRSLALGNGLERTLNKRVKKLTRTSPESRVSPLETL